MYSQYRDQASSMGTMPAMNPIQNAGYMPAVDYNAQRSYGISPPTVGIPSAHPLLFPAYMPAGPMPGMADGMRPYGHLAPMSLNGTDAEAGYMPDGVYHPQMPGAVVGRSPYFWSSRPRLTYQHRGGMPGRGPPVDPGRARERDGLTAGRGNGRGAKSGQRKKRVQKGLEDNVKRTVYISYIDSQVTEQQLAEAFSDVGKVVDCRICGDPNSAMRFAFIEFTSEEAAEKALQKTGSVLGNSPLRVLPSKTAIVPVNKDLMPQTDEELERCSRTVYAANIDKKVDKTDVKNFFEQLCGKVSRIRLLGDFAHSTRIAFIEFVQAEGAMAALNCSGALLGSLPIRVSPSKTPVRMESEKSALQQQQVQQQAQQQQQVQQEE